MKETRRIPPKRDGKITLYFMSGILLIYVFISWYCRGLTVTLSSICKYSFYAMMPFLLLRIYTLPTDVLYMIDLKPYNIFKAIGRSVVNNFPHNIGRVIVCILPYILAFCMNNNPDRSLVHSCLGSQKTEDSELWGCIDMFIFFTLIAYYNFIGMDEYPTKKAMSIEQEWSSMAAGFYYGYLKIILNTLPGKIEDYKERETIGNSFKVNKLLILIPSSTVIFDQVANLYSEFIAPTVDPPEENVEQPLEHRVTRAYVVNRSYKNTIYRIKDPKTDKIYYTVFEGATPIKTFYEQCKEEPTLMAYRRETVYAFYNTLKKLLDNDPIIKDFVELVYYEDDEKPGHGSENSGLLNIILDRLKEIIRKQEIDKIKLRT